jgi:2-polyprenyl-3-methyl-5-hydroxy-6-metoxy-1,4-benzoquinol methylase
MEVNVNRLSSCRACNSSHLEKVIDFGHSAIADDYFKEQHNTVCHPLACCLCGGCGLLQLDHVVDPSDIYDDYIYWSTSSPGLDKHFESYAHSTFDLLRLSEQSLVLDIGCNDGMLLRHFKNLGCQVLGIEPSSQIAEHANESALNVINSYWDAASSELVRAEYPLLDVITANNVFANVDKIYEFTQCVASVLAPDGVFVIETGYHLSLIENFVFDNIYHEHLSYFSVTSLQHFFEQFNMDVFHVEKVDTKGGSIRVFTSFKGSKNNRDSSVDKAIANELNAKLYSATTYQYYEKRLHDLKTEVHEHLQSLKDKGVKIIGFGASATVTTVLYALHIGQYFSFLVDDNPLKQDTFSPGFQIPVKSTKAMYIDEPCCVVVLPWRFADMFVSRNQAFLNVHRSILKIIPRLETITVKS